MMGKDAYHAFHVEMGTRDAPAFERLPSREQEAWVAVSRHIGSQYDYIQELLRRAVRAENELGRIRQSALSPKRRKAAK